MCLMCEGFTREQFNEVIAATIVRYGWSVQGVTPTDDDRQPPFAYTIGLTESYGLPELVVAGMDHEASVDLLNAVGELLVEGRSLDEAVRGFGGRHGVVDRQRLASGDWFGAWEAYYGEAPAPGAFVQVLLPASAYCPCHGHLVPDLTHPGGATAGNRAARRAAAAKRRRR